MDLLRLAAADLVLVLVGAVQVWPLARRVGLPLPPRVALCFITGVGVLAVASTLLGVAGLPTGVLPVLGPVLAAAALAGLILIGRNRRGMPARQTRRPRPAPTPGSATWSWPR